MSFKITGTGHAVPSRTLSNEELTHMVDTSDEWITSRTGIQNRYIVTDENLTELAARAGRDALDRAGIEGEDLDLIICATLQGDYITPSLACLVQRALQATCPAFDVNAACSGFLYALDVAAGYFARGKVRRVLVVAADAVSRYTDWADRGTCVLFGDAAGAVVLEPGDDLLALNLTAAGGAGSLNIPGRKGTFPGAPDLNEPEVVNMIGQDIYKFAVTNSVRDVQQAMDDAGITPEDVTYVLAHQANIRILDTAMSKLPIDDEKFYTVIDRYGNISAASIPTMLDELDRGGKLHRGDLLVFTAFGAGLTTGAGVLRWSRDQGDDAR